MHNRDSCDRDGAVSGPVTRADCGLRSDGLERGHRTGLLTGCPERRRRPGRAGDGLTAPGPALDITLCIHFFARLITQKSCELGDVSHCSA